MKGIHMDKFKVISVKESVFSHNEKRAEELRNFLKGKGVYLLNVMSSPGSGKTTLLVSLINKLKDQIKIAVMEADIDGAVDAETISDKTGVKTIQLHTNGACHLDAEMTKEGLDGLGIEGFDLVILENVGNLVCPAEFDTGAASSLNILSIPEGDDKPLKYPLMFKVCSTFVFSKIDTLPYFDFSIDQAKENILRLNSRARFFPVSAKTGEGIDDLAAYLLGLIKTYKEE